jgi:23S rRNA (guanine745-N1)-methyltransferase
MLEHVVDALSCPHGESGFVIAANGLVCPAGHRFDIARQGYANLLLGAAPAAADTAAMVAAREQVQSAGHHDVLGEALVHAAMDVGRSMGGDRTPRMVVDLGAGTGHHLAQVVERTGATAGLALDVSKFAARRAARVHPRVGAVVCDVWQRLPIRDGAASLVLNVFAPRHVAEIARILAPEGTLIVATPTPDHLAPLVERLGLLRVGDDKLDRLDTDLSDVAVLRGRDVVEAVITLDHAAVAAMVAMGPSAHHLDAPDLAVTIAELPEVVQTTISVTVSSYVRR